MWMLLHGFTGSPRSWSPVITHAELDPPPLIPALAGHGRDWRSTEVESFETEVTRLLSLVSNGESPRLLCGYSMGARVALGLLARQPSAFDAAVLIGVHPGLSDETARTARHDLDANRARLLRKEGVAAFVNAWEELPLFASQRALCEETLTSQREIRLSHDAEGLARALEILGLGEMPDYRAAMSSADTPITLVTGSRDAKFCEIAGAIAEENAHVDAELVDGIGHNVVLEKPAAIAAVLERVEGRVR
jgi:2-succinyl-6-hydroxy-2,4-cyclohexadiene-1-carboxylate synthase